MTIEKELLAHQAEAAMLSIETMDDFEALNTAVGNAHDLLDRLNTRIMEIEMEQNWRRGSAGNTVFVYGTLKPGGLLWEGIAPLVEKKTPAILEGWGLLTFGAFPGIKEAEFNRVQGFLLHIKEGKEAIAWAMLDHVEGVNRGLYERREVKVWISGNADDIDTVTYVPTPMLLTMQWEWHETSNW